MIIIGCDYHPGFQQIAFVDTETGECGERRLEHREEAEKFYRDLEAEGAAVRLGMEASGHALAGLNECCQSCGLSCGSALRFRPAWSSGHASRRSRHTKYANLHPTRRGLYSALAHY